MKKKILHLLWSGGIGGIEEYITGLVKRFDSSKYEVHICFMHKKGILYDEAKKSNKNAAFIGLGRFLDIIHIIQFIKYLKWHNFDIIHCHTENIITNLIIVFFSRAKLLFTAHMNPGASFLFYRRRMFYFLFKNFYHKFIAISEFVRHQMVDIMNIEHKKTVTIYNGISPEKFNDSISVSLDIESMRTQHNKIIGYVGRLEAMKGPDIFIRIAHEILKIRNNIIFILVGDGSMYDDCKKYINDYNLENSIKLSGYRRDIPNILKCLDALIFPSKDEGFGIVNIEAMAMGVPVFAINTPAIGEIISHKKNGFLMNSNDPAVVAVEILKFMDDPELMVNIKKQCIKDAISNFSIDASVKKHDNLYDTLVA